MPELTDDQLDGLFRKSAEEFDPPFDPVAWRDMKTRLDANERTVTGDAKTWKGLLRWGLPILLLVLLTGGIWYAYRKTDAVVVKADPQLVTKAAPTLNRPVKQPPHTAEIPTSENKPVRTTTAGLKESEANAAKQPTDGIASVAEPVKAENRFDKPVGRVVKTLAKKTMTSSDVEMKRVASAYELKAKRIPSVRSRRIGSETASDKSIKAGTSDYRPGETDVWKTGLALSRKRRRAAGSRYDVASETMHVGMMPKARLAFGRQRTPVGQESLSVNTADITGNTILSGAGEPGSVTFPTLAELMVRPGNWPKLTAFASRDVIVQPDTVSRSAVPESASQKEKGFSVRVVVAPDLSSVGLKNFARPGTNVGVLLEYRLASRWSVQAGIIQSTKIYRVLGSEYKSAYLSKDVTSIDGQCNMLDIPINIRYDFALRPRLDGRLPNRWFISGGMTSYIMKQEDYIPNYSGYVHNPPAPYSGSSGAYGFSQLNVSVGYEHAFSKRLSWQVEPFMKVPLKGVGYYKINLISTGAFFSIRYKLSK